MLSSKGWMCLLVSGIVLFASNHSNAQSSSRYPSAQRNQARTVQRSGVNSFAGQHVAPPAPPQSRVAQAYVPQHLQSGIQTGVVAPPVERTVSTSEPVAQTAQISGSGSRGVASPIYDNVISGSGSRVVGSPIYDNVVPGSGSRAVATPYYENVVGSSVGPVHGTIIDSGPVIVGGTGQATHSISTGCSACPTGGCGTGFGGPIDLGVGQTYFDGGGSCGGSCGIAYDDCCGRGGCPPYQNCWLNRLFGSFSGAEFFVGGVGFRSEQFQVPGLNTNDVFDDSSFGFQGGFNVGVPLCNLTCGLISGQIGVRHITSNFDGNSFSDSSRNQTFFTAGLFRRVDYGLQVGVVADVLREEWFTDSQVVQLRGDIAWVYPAGSAFGFRFATQLDEDVSDGTIDGLPFTDLQTTSLETYRFYYRRAAAWGGFVDFSAGWSDSDHFVLGLDHDIPVSETISLQSSLTYLSGDDLPIDSPFAGNGNEAWNVSVGIAWRPRGRSWYRSYNTPVLPVADNGSLILRRGLQ